MKIKPRDLLWMVRFPHDLAIGEAVVIVHRAYCGQMTTRGLCSQNCLDCEERLREAFTFKGIARNSAGLLTWRLRDAVGKAAEEKAANAKIQTTTRKDEFGIPLSEKTNPFMEFIDEIKT